LGRRIAFRKGGSATCEEAPLRASSSDEDITRGPTRPCGRTDAVFIVSIHAAIPS
jgi:hypothetical protein